ncbi:protein-glutamate O-methyltransferase [Roseicyclus sp. F158]|uniref:Chemotaxis protein methyltransferase n=1 Tax=Tropicimonas omnivorans TaxID=3075590 RepID=A0ABU3DJG7_9RHOB|nr:protein-glutamate O-methyltransferase [Roseicyclus sp. F158]MDT0683859.1 protein-glutamate O-methyltransferase [Roseicyclus sp. F158]
MTSAQSSFSETDRQVDFARIADIARAEAGLQIPQEKASMVFSRLAKRARKLGLPDIASYLAVLDGPNGKDERRGLIEALTTNVTSFFREPHHFDHLAEKILPSLMDAARKGERVRIWSAGCSTGAEPYTIAMCVLEACPEAAQLDIRILATDIDRDVLATAEKGVYAATLLKKVPPEIRAKYFSERSRDGDTLRACENLRALCTFRPLNLMTQWPMRGAFDIIFCRNVVIYFDAETQAALWPRFEALLKSGGHLFVGHSERVEGVPATELVPVGTTTYRKGGAQYSGSRERY